MYEASIKHKLLKKTSSAKINLGNPEIKSSKFDVLYSQALKEVKRKIPIHQQNFPLIKMKSYEKPILNYEKDKKLRYSSQLPFQKTSQSLNQQKSTSFINKRMNCTLIKKSPNRILWQKKMSLQTLRISSCKNNHKNSRFSIQIHKQSLKNLRSKTLEAKFTQQQNQFNLSSQISILPLTLNPEKYRLSMKDRKLSQKFKLNTFNKKQEQQNKILFSNKNYHNDKWLIQKDQDQFINFVQQKKNTIF